MISITDQLHHTLRIIHSCSYQTWCSVHKRIHGIIKMCYMMSSHLHRFHSTVIISSCMSQGNTYFFMHFPDKIAGTFYIGCKCHQADQPAGSLIQLPYQVCIRPAYPLFYMSTLSGRIKKRTFHVNSPDNCFILPVFCLSHCLKDPVKLFFWKSHGCRTV